MPLPANVHITLVCQLSPVEEGTRQENEMGVAYGR